MSDLTLPLLGLAALALLGKSSNAATPTSRSAGGTTSYKLPIFNRGLSTGWINQPARLGARSSAGSGFERTLGSAFGGAISSSGFKSAFGDFLADKLGIPSASGIARDAAATVISDGAEAFVLDYGTGAAWLEPWGASAAVEAGGAEAFVLDYGTGATWLEPWGASAAVEAGGAEIAASTPWGAVAVAAAVVDSEVFDGQVGQTVVDEGNNLANSVADIFGW